MSAAERSRHKMFATAIKESEGEESRRKEVLAAKRQAIKDDLENQMRCVSTVTGCKFLTLSTDIGAANFRVWRLLQVDGLSLLLLHRYHWRAPLRRSMLYTNKCDT